MNKSISKEQIVEETLELLRERQDLKSVNLREIARKLGCAHTNLYNYFPSYNDLLWEVHTALQEIFMEKLRESFYRAKTPEIKLKIFFETFLRLYVYNIGWFRLSWMEYIGQERPESNVIAVKSAREELDRYVCVIWEEFSGRKVKREKAAEAMHSVHCYIIGEISNYITGRGLIKNKTEFQNYVALRAEKLLKLCLSEEE